MVELIVSVGSVERAKALSIELQTVLMKESFNLKKWASNNSDGFGHEKPAINNPAVLGLEWPPERDKLKFCHSVSFKNQQQWAQRKVLSEVSSLLDPLV